MRVVLKSSGKPIAKKEGTRMPSPRNTETYGNGTATANNVAATMGDGNSKQATNSSGVGVSHAQAASLESNIPAGAGVVAGAPANVNRHEEERAVSAPVVVKEKDAEAPSLSKPFGKSTDIVSGDAASAVTDVQQQIEGVFCFVLCMCVCARACAYRQHIYNTHRVYKFNAMNCIH
jgi:hypothetical protein